MSPWIAAELARLRHDELRREAARHQWATSSADNAGRHTAARWLGSLLIRVGRRLGGDADLGRSRLPSLGTVDVGGDGPGLGTARGLPVRLQANC